jgi:hypothetical protein
MNCRKKSQRSQKKYKLVPDGHGDGTNRTNRTKWTGMDKHGQTWTDTLLRHSAVCQSGSAGASPRVDGNIGRSDFSRKSGSRWPPRRIR